jgi:PEP-CTERM motif
MRRLALWTPARRGVKTLLALASALSAPLALPAHATTFTTGEFVTWSQVAWGGDPFCEPSNPSVCNISGLLENDFNSLFAPSDLLELGVPGAGGFSMIFDSADSIIGYLPAGGSPGALIADLLDPVHTASGALGGEVLTATLNVTFSEDGLLAHPTGVPFGDLLLQNLDSLPGDPSFGNGVGPEIAELDGMSVRDVLADANALLGGAASPFTPQDLFVVLNDIDMSFNGGPVSGFAAQYLALPEGSTVPEPSTWAMLLIGFAGLGIAGWRSSRGSKRAAGWTARPSRAAGRRN